jgi:hypothetical protein
VNQVSQLKNEYRIFDTLLLFASNEGQETLPSSEFDLIVEIAAGLVDFLGGKGDQCPNLSTTRYSRECWQQTVNKLVEKTLEQHGDKLNPQLRDALKNLIHLESCHSHGESWWESPLRFYLLFLACRNPMSSTFALSVPFVTHTKNQLQNLPPDIVAQCQMIAQAMKPYVRKDVEYIRANFSW